MTDITSIAQRMREAAEKLNSEQWQVRNGEVIVKGSVEKGSFFVSYQPVAADVVDSKTANAIALFSPANVQMLLDALAQRDTENAELRAQIAALTARLSRYSMSAGEADQRMSESRAVRVALGFGADAEDVAPCDLVERINALWGEGINYAASRLAAAYNHGFVDKPLAEVRDVVRMILDAKDELAKSALPASDGLSGEYAEKSVEEWTQQLREGKA